MTTANVLEWGSTATRVRLFVLTDITETPEVLRKNVLTLELIAKRMAIGTSADRSQFRPWTEVRDALRTRNP